MTDVGCIPFQWTEGGVHGVVGVVAVVIVQKDVVEPVDGTDHVLVPYRKVWGGAVLVGKKGNLGAGLMVVVSCFVSP